MDFFRLKKNVNKLNFVSILTIASIAFILYCLYLSAGPVLKNDIGFNTDLARDFLLLENIQETRDIPLIGPRSGGIPGVFHGPSWIFLNLPAFIIGDQNPVIVGWFWILLIVISLGITYFVGRKVYGHIVGILAAVLVALASIPNSHNLFNPYGAVIFSPLFLYYLYKYFIENRARDLIFSLFILGVVIQFQVAFGAPLLILAAVIIIYQIIKRKNFKHLLAFIILVVPFSTYLVFDLRHDFLELRSIILYITGNSGEVNDFYFIDLVKNRYDGIINSLVIVPYASKLVIALTVSVYVSLFYKNIKSNDKYAKFFLLFCYFFVGYWIMTFLFKGVVWSYYYWPFMPLVAIIMASALKYMNKFVFAIFFLILLYFSFNYSYNYSEYIKNSFVGKDGGSWQFNLSLAETVFSQNDKEFSYYIFSPDQFGYSPKYAMNYLAGKRPGVKAQPYSKSKTTYLIIAPPGGDGNSIGGEWWKVNRVKITNEPIEVINFPNGFKIEKHNLSEDDISIPSDPNLIDSLIFR